MKPGTGASELEALHQIQRLADDYAAAVDGRDAPALRAVFEKDAELVTYRDALGEVVRMRFSGHAEIDKVIERMQAYDATFHLIGNRRYEVTGGSATGHLYCEAHHRTYDVGGGTDLVMYIKYHDEYRLGSDSRWRIAVRRLYPEWMDLRTCRHPDLQVSES